MKPEFLTPPQSQLDSEERNAPASRFIDEKISDNSDTEAKADKALAPTGLKNPFWK